MMISSMYGRIVIKSISTKFPVVEPVYKNRFNPDNAL